MTRFSLIAICIALLIFTPVFASEGFSCASSRDDAIVIDWELPGYDFTQEDGEYVRIIADTPAWTGDYGSPELPLFSTMAGLPNTGAVSLEWEILEDEWLDATPISYKEPDAPVWRNPDVYGGVYPESPFQLTDPGVIRNRRVGGVSVSPFVWHGDGRGLQVIHRARLTVRIDPSQRGVNEIYRQMPTSRSFESMFEKTVVNYSSQPLRDEFQQPCVLFISYNSTVQSTMALLPLWKHYMGYEVHNVNMSETGSTNSSIKNYIQNAYDTWANPPEFVVLVGDAASTSFNVPTWTHTFTRYTGEGDHPYTLLEGNDQLEDIFIGRLSFSTTTELQVIVNKVLKYEREPYMASTAWYNDNLLVGDTSDSGISCISTNKYIKELMEAYSSSHDFTELYGLNPSTTQMDNAINAGVLYFNYRGWYGMSGWTNSNIAGLTNTNKLPVSVIITCDTGSFANGTARTEALLRRGTPSAPAGGICAVGMATTGTHTAYNNCLNGGIFEGLFVEDMRTMGEAMQRGRTYLWEVYNNSQPGRVETFSHICNLMGDPTLQVWKDRPRSMNASFPSSIPPETEQIVVHVTDSMEESIANAWVTIIQGSDVIFATGWTDENGYVTLPVTPGNSGTVNLTVTHPGHIPILSSFSISSATAGLQVSDMIFDDDASGSSSGNGDGVVNPGESIEWRVQLDNIGNQSLTNVTAQISLLDSDWITTTDSYETWGTISIGLTDWCSDDFDFTIDPACPGGTEIRMLLNISSSAYSTQQIVTITVEGPALEMDLCNVVDGGNGVLDPAETSSVYIRLRNDGSLASVPMTATLSCSNEQISFPTATSSYAAISTGMTQMCATPFVITADQDMIPGSVVNMTLELSGAGGEEAVANFPFTVGVSIMGDPLGPDSYGYSIYDNEDESYDLAPFYSWIEIDPSYGGNGTNCNLNDNGEDQDDVVVVSLPFTAKFYGQTYSQISICSNGWFSFGASEQITFRNWRMPGPLGPAAQVAVFWDDLKMGNGDVYRWYDSANHRFVIQWSRMQNMSGSAGETFQAVIYDPAYHTTPTGDSDILLQYFDVNNVDDNGYSDHGCYATVGIEDHTGLVGLEYTFDQLYPASARMLQDGLALFITTKQPQVIGPPVAVIDNLPHEYYLQPNATTSDDFTIGNVGDSPLHYNITKQFDAGRPGGPDTFGYSWVSSADPGGPSYQWFNIQSIGTAVAFTSDDQMSSTISIGFSFPFYGNNYTTLRICSNGFVSFTDTDTDYTNDSIPDATAPNNIIAPFWDDLSPQISGSVHYYRDSANGRFIMQFTDVDHYAGTWNGEYTFQMQIYDNGVIYFYYHELEGDINTNTVGIENASGTDGLQVAFDQTYVQNGMAIKIMKAPEWLTLSPENGVVDPDDIDTINLDIDTTDLELGDYTCMIYVSTNDPNATAVEIPVTLHVADQIYPPMAPTNMYIAWYEGDAWLQWAPVTQDTHGNPVAVNHYNIYRCPVGQELTATPENLYATTTQTSFQDTAPLADGARYIVTADTAAPATDNARR